MPPESSEYALTLWGSYSENRGIQQGNENYRGCYEPAIQPGVFACRKLNHHTALYMVVCLGDRGLNTKHLKTLRIVLAAAIQAATPPLCIAAIADKIDPFPPDPPVRSFWMCSSLVFSPQ